MEKSIGSLCYASKLSAWIKETEEIPFFGKSPPCNLDKLSSLLSAALDLNGLNLSFQAPIFKEKGPFLEGLQPHPLLLKVNLAPLHSPLYFLMSQENIEKLLSSMVRKSKMETFASPLKEGFSRFLALQAAHALSQVEPFLQFTIQLEETKELPSEPSVMMDIELAWEEKTCFGRLLIPSSFRTQWIRHFASQPVRYHTTAASSKIELWIKVEIGSTRLQLSEWNEIQPGDFLLLDRSSYRLADKTGLATLKLDEISLFQAKIHHEKIELLDFAIPTEDTMEENDAPESENLPLEEGQSSPQEDVKSIRDIPLSVCVELARLRLTLDQLMHLNPGNTLTLPIHPEQPLHLTVNGEKIAKAELLQVGDTLGVRILEIN